MQNKPFTFDRVIRLLLWFIIAALAVTGIVYLKGVLLPFLIACLIAYVLEPVVQVNRSVLGLKGRALAVFCTLFEVTTMLCILAYFCIPSIIEETHQMASMLKTYVANGSHTPLLPDFIHRFIRENINLAELAERMARQDMGEIIQKSMSVLSGGFNILIDVLEWLLVFIYVIFIMLDYNNLMRGFKLLVPPGYRLRTFRLWQNVIDSMDHYFRGQALIALIIAVSYSIGFSIIGIPLAVVIGISIGILFMVPYLQYITLIPVTLLCIVYSVDTDVSFWTIWWECIALYAFNEVFANLILVPKILGKAMGLNPAIILLSLSVWGSLMGIIGMIIALPLTTLLISYYNEYLNRLNKKRQSLDE